MYSCQFVPELFHALDEMNFLFWEHPREDLASLHDPVQQRLVVAPDQPERLPVARKHVVLLLDRFDEVRLTKKEIIKLNGVNIFSFYVPPSFPAT